MWKGNKYYPAQHLTRETITGQRIFMQVNVPRDPYDPEFQIVAFRHGQVVQKCVFSDLIYTHEEAADLLALDII